MRRIINFILVLALFGAFFGTAIYLQHRALEKVRRQAPFVETWQLAGRSGEVLKLLSLQYDQLVADFLWLRAIQSFGGRGMSNRDWEPLYNMFDTITELDPYFEDAYSFGNMVIGDEAGKQKEALGLINKGMFHLPRQYRLPFEGMYVSHWDMKDNKLARWYGRLASKRADAPDWVPRMTAYIEVQSGEFYLAFNRYVGNLLMALESRDRALEILAIGKAKEAVEKWNASTLTRAYEQYTSATGQLPASIDDLTTMPALQNYEIARISRLIAGTDAVLTLLGADPISADLLNSDTPENHTVLPTAAQRAEAMDFFTKLPRHKKLSDYENDLFHYSMVKQNGLPEDPEGFPYVLNMSQVGNPASDAVPIVTEPKRLEALKDTVTRIRKYIIERKEELGHLPQSLHEAFYTDFNTTEPYGAKWTYDPKTGDFRSTSHPDL